MLGPILSPNQDSLCDQKKLSVRLAMGGSTQQHLAPTTSTLANQGIAFTPSKASMNSPHEQRPIMGRRNSR
jgi:hypothetical protein